MHPPRWVALAVLWSAGLAAAFVPAPRCHRLAARVASAHEGRAGGEDSPADAGSAPVPVPPKSTPKPSKKPKSLLGKVWQQATGKEYEFGDITRAIDAKAKQGVAKLAGKENDEYEFGDLSRLVDKTIKEGVAELAGKDEYELGDLSRTLDSKAKQDVAKLAGKDEYEFGDLSRTLDQSAKSTAAQFAGKDEYQFGDVSRALDAKAKAAVSKFTGKDQYEVGDLTRALDAKAKAAVAAAAGKDQYEFGDLSRLIDAKSKAAVCRLTGKDEYEFGDVTRTISQQVLSRDYSIDELYFLVRALLSFGLGLSPVAGFMPVKVLMDLMNYALLAEAGDRVAKALATEVDKKAKKAITGDEDYTLGDLSKRGIREFIGKDSYQIGDVSRALKARLSEAPGGVGPENETLLTLAPSGQESDAWLDGSGMEGKDGALQPWVVRELERWDQEFEARSGELELELEQWDKQLEARSVEATAESSGGPAEGRDGEKPSSPPPRPPAAW